VSGFAAQEALSGGGEMGAAQLDGQQVLVFVSQVEISRRVTLEKLPPVLVLHLKRFVYEKTGGCQKLIKNIDYPVDLEISKGKAEAVDCHSASCSPLHAVRASKVFVGFFHFKFLDSDIHMLKILLKCPLK
jgi:hypothetical protein